jgi:WD40 repeat protein
VSVNRLLSEGFEFVVLPAQQPEASQTVELTVPDVTGAAWSPDGQQVAVNFYEGTGKTWTLHIYDRQGNLIDSSSFGFRVWDIAWSPDQRFVLMPGSDDQGTHAVLIYDTQTSLLTPVGFTTWIHWVAVRG